MSNDTATSRHNLGRRLLLRGSGIAALGLPLGAMAPRSFAPANPLAAPPICHVADEHAMHMDNAPLPKDLAIPGPRRNARLVFNANSICTVGVPVALKLGYFERNNVDVELVNFGGSTDQLLEAIATGKAEAGVGMALRWLKPLEQGFDVKITAGIHGGCMRLLASHGSPLGSIADLKGKVIGTSDLASPDKNFFSIMAAKAGLDIEKDITWKTFPADLLSEALKRGQVDAFTAGDPIASVLRDRDGLREVANNLTGEFATRTCCVFAVGSSVVKNDLPLARALTGSLLQAQGYVHSNPEGAAEIFAPYSKVPAPALAAMLRSHTQGSHPTGNALRTQLAEYIDELKLIDVIRKSTNTQRLAGRIEADVLGGTPA